MQKNNCCGPFVTQHGDSKLDKISMKCTIDSTRNMYSSWIHTVLFSAILAGVQSLDWFHECSVNACRWQIFISLETLFWVLSNCQCFSTSFNVFLEWVLWWVLVSWRRNVIRRAAELEVTTGRHPGYTSCYYWPKGNKKCRTNVLLSLCDDCGYFRQHAAQLIHKWRVIDPITKLNCTMVFRLATFFRQPHLPLERDLWWVDSLSLVPLSHPRTKQIVHYSKSLC